MIYFLHQELCADLRIKEKYFTKVISMAEISLKMADTNLNEEGNKAELEDEDFVDPWSVSSKSETGIDYDKLIRKLFVKGLAVPLLKDTYTKYIFRAIW